MERLVISRSRARRVLAAAAILVATLSSTTVASGQPAEEGDDSGVAITVEAVTPWVGPDGDWTAELRVTGAPADAKVSYSIRQPPTGTEAAVRESLVKSRDGDDEPKVMRAAVSQPLASVTDASGTTRVEFGIRAKSGDRERFLIPNSGVYPVVVTIAASDGAALEQITLYLNRLPGDGAEGPAPFRLGVLLQQPRLGGFDDQGAVEVSPELRSSVEAISDQLSAASGLPVRVDLSPESLVALTQSETAGDLQLVERLRRELASASVVRVPWAGLHLEGWASSGTLPEVQTSLIDGQQALDARLQRPVDVRVWPPDDTAGPESVELLTRLGVTALVVDPDQLAESKPPAGESGFTRPFAVRGSADASVTGISLDPDLQDLLETTTDSPALAAHQMVTQLIGAWLADDRERGSLLRIGEGADPDVVDELMDVLRSASSDSGPISVVDPADVAALAPITARQGGRDEAWTRELLAPADVPRVGGIAQRLKTARPLADDYAAIVPRGDETAAREAIIVQRSMDQRVSPGVQETLLDTAVATMQTDLDKISASEPRTLTLTSRISPVPLRFTNDLGRPLKVRLRLQSPRLVFLDGDEQELTLQPGLNRLDVEVEVRTSGQFTMQADLLAPDSDRVLASTQQRIRSRTFSGVGLMLSGGALLFLVIWWSRTLRRRDRTGPADDPDDPDDAPGGATEAGGPATPDRPAAAVDPGHTGATASRS